MSEAKGPYFANFLSLGMWGIGGPGRDAKHPEDEAGTKVLHLNEGFYRGRESRDGLRKALENILGQLPKDPKESRFPWHAELFQRLIKEALEADGDGK